MLRRILISVSLFASLGWSAPTLAVDFFWTGPLLGGPGGNFRTAQNWTFDPPPFPLVPAPGDAGDTVNFDLGRDPEDRYTVTSVRGENDRLIVHDDSFTLVVADSFIGVDYVLSNASDTSPSLTVGVALGDTADVVLEGATNSASISTQATTIGRAAFSTGVLTVDNLHWVGDGDLVVGESGSGTLTIRNGADVTSDHGSLGLNEGLAFFGSGAALVTGDGSTWNIDEGLIVGVEGAGTLSIEAGGSVSNGDGSIGQLTADSMGEVTVTGDGSTWTNENLLLVGIFGTGTLTIADGGSVTDTNATMSFNADSNATATVTGAGSTWTSSEDLDVGLNGTADVTIAEGGSITNVVGRIAINAGSTGDVTVTDDGSTWNNSGDLYVGNIGDGTLVIADGGNVENFAGRIADQPGSTGMATITGSGSTWSNASSLVIGREGSGELHVEAGGSVTSRGATIGFTEDATGDVTVTGNGSRWSNLSLIVGETGRGDLLVTQGGVVTSDINGVVAADPGSIANVHVRDPGSAWNIGNDLSVGLSGLAAFNVQNGAAITSAAGYIGREAGSSGFAIVTGAQSTWTISERLSIGGDAETGANGGTATLSVSLGGTVDVAQDTVLFPNGLLRLHESGTLATTAISFEGGGEFDWVGGTLHVDVFEGNLTNPVGGTLAPGRSAGSTTIVGDYTQQAGATLAIEIGGTATATEFDFVDVNGTATLGGELEVSLINGFLPDPADEFTIFNADDDLLSFFTNAGNGQRLDTIDGNGSFLVHYGPTSAFEPNQIVLTGYVPAPLLGDYNNNGVVDAADYPVWRDTLGSDTALAADGNQNGVVDPGDYDIWKENFGMTAGTGSGPGATGSASAITPVPEPASLLLLIIAVSAIIGALAGHAGGS